MRVRLRFAQGHYRIGQVALVALAGEAAALTLDPVRVEGADGERPRALARLLDPERYLVTHRGDTYRLHYDLSALAGEHEFFLESRSESHL